jgi:hypothetical protein
MNNICKCLFLCVFVGLFHGCSGYRHRTLNIHGIYEYEDLSRPRRGIEVKLIESPNAPAMYQMLIRPVGDGTVTWPFSEQEQRVKLWYDISEEQCEHRGLQIFHSPSVGSISEEYCGTSFRNIPCGISGISGDFSCKNE